MEIIRKKGNEALLERPKTAFFCSRNAPRRMAVIVEDWVESLSPEVDCVLCGAHSPVERQTLSLLLRRKVPTIMMLAEAMRGSWDADVTEALAENRLLIVTHCGENVHYATARSAFDRNVLMMSMAEKIVVGYLDKGGNLERALANARNVDYLLTDTGDDPTFYIDPVELYGKEQTLVLKGDLDDWERGVETATSHLTLGFNGHGDDLYAWIERTDRGEAEEKRSGKICLGLAEMVKFCDVLRTAFHLMEDGKLAEKEPRVASLSGEITFEAERDGPDGTLLVTQTKDMGNMGVRRRIVRLEADEALAFYDTLLETRDKFMEYKSSGGWR